MLVCSSANWGPKRRLLASIPKRRWLPALPVCLSLRNNAKHCFVVLCLGFVPKFIDAFRLSLEQDKHNRHMTWTFMGLRFIVEAVFSWRYELRPKNHWPSKHFAFYEKSTGSKYLARHERSTNYGRPAVRRHLEVRVSRSLLLTHYTEQSPSWEANRFSARQEIPRLLWNPKLITTFTSVRHLSLSWASRIQTMSPHPKSWRSI
jgi:hypothetical protein